MAFKMTPGIKGNSTNNSIMGGGCGGDGQPPCPPRFQAEKMMAPVADKSSSSRSKSIRVKKKAKIVKTCDQLKDDFKDIKSIDMSDGNQLELLKCISNDNRGQLQNNPKKYSYLSPERLKEQNIN